MLPLLREDQDSEKGKTSTVEERVIGAGLKALDKHEDGAAAKELFHMFAVTMEDFVHPIAVIELLWRSCCVCGSGSEKEEEGSLATRLKVRQWTQMRYQVGTSDHRRRRQLQRPRQDQGGPTDRALPCPARAARAVRSSQRRRARSCAGGPVPAE